MTSQLTPEKATPVRHKKDETSERIYLQPWFLLAIACMVAMVLLVVNG
jgi:preprotein translocase subunit Sec61beta